MTQQWLLGWWNLIFILPFGLGLLYLGIYTLSGWTFGETDLDHDLSVDHDVDVDHDIAVDHDVSVDASVEHDADLDQDAEEDHDGDGGTGHGALTLAVLNWLGVGKVPVSLILMVIMLAWGVIGFCSNQAMIDRPLGQMALASMGISFVGTMLITRVVSGLVGKYLPTSETYARNLESLVGSVGEALFNIDAKFGMVCGRDDRGEQFQLPCRTLPGRASIVKGTKVILAVYDEKERLFSVIPTEPGDSAQTPRVARRPTRAG